MAAITACNGRQSSSSPSIPPGAAFIEPEELVSANGRLAVTLTAEAQSVPYGSGTRFANTYNGSVPGPTLRVRPGDELTVTLRNRLNVETNLHTHGLHVSPAAEADNIFVMVAPGDQHTYTYKIPADHPSGLFWYHPHAHGTVADQVAAGLAGAIIVVDAIDESSEIASSTERLWVLSDPRIGARASDLAIAKMERMQGREGDVVLINGEAKPMLTTKAGSLERWRFVNASASRYYRLALEGHQFSVIASDGGRLAAPVPAAEVLLAPGERTELLVTPTKAGSYRMRALAYDRGSPAMGAGMGGGRSSSSVDVTIATVSVIGDAAAATLPGALATQTAPVTQPVTSTRVVTLAMGGAGGGIGGGGGMGGGGMMGFTIDDKTFDGARTDITATLGTTEQWTIRNTSPMDHPFHIHVWPFEIVDGPATAGWKDTVNVPAKSSVDIRIRFADFAGRTVYHCHILDHEDLGMMGVIEVTG